MASKSEINLSVIVAAWNNVELLTQCLTSLLKNGDLSDTEIIIASNYDAGVKRLIKEKFSMMHCIILPKNTSVPELRREGIYQSKGEFVALLEDHCTVDKNWCAAIKAGHASGHPIIGGSVENENGACLVDWAVYFYEYGKYMLPLQTGTAEALSGNNVSYKKTLLEAAEGSFEKGFYEIFMHWKFKELGYSLYSVPSAIVYHKKNYGIRETLSTCYHHGRSFAGMRIRETKPFRRLKFTLASFVLPLLLPARILAAVFKKRRHFRELLLSLPFIFLFMTSWAFGEFCGYSFGEGASAGKWR